jgi:hypothetical protein
MAKPSIVTVDQDIDKFQRDVTVLSGQKDAVRATAGVASAIEGVRGARGGLPEEELLPISGVPPPEPPTPDLYGGTRASLMRKLREKVSAGYRDVRERAPLKIGEAKRSLPGEARRRFTETLRGGPDPLKDDITRKYGQYTGRSIIDIESDYKRYRDAKDQEGKVPILAREVSTKKSELDDINREIDKLNNNIEDANNDLNSARDDAARKRLQKRIDELEARKSDKQRNRNVISVEIGELESAKIRLESDVAAANRNIDDVKREREAYNRAYQEGYKKYAEVTGWRGAERAVSKELAERGTWLTKFSGERLDTGKLKPVTDFLASPITKPGELGDRWSGIFGKRTAGYPTTSVTDVVTAGGAGRTPRERLDFLGQQVSLGRRATTMFGMPSAPPGGRLTFSMTSPVKAIGVGDVGAMGIRVRRDERPRMVLREISMENIPGEPRQQRIRLRGKNVYARIRLPSGYGKLSMGKPGIGIAPARFEMATIAQCKGTVIDMKNIAKGVDMSSITGKKKRRGKK